MKLSVFLLISLFGLAKVGVRAECGAECFPGKMHPEIDPHVYEMENEEEEDDDVEERWSLFGFTISFTSDNTVEFDLYTRDNPSVPVTYVSGSNTFYSSFNASKPTKILVHGWLNDGDSSFNTLIKDAYLNKFDYNVIVVDWSKASRNLLYNVAAGHVPETAKTVAAFIDRLASDFGADPSTIHLIGFSLGAHVSGIAGVTITSGTLDRVTGLDPAFPLFRDKDTTGRLSNVSASFVDVLHTCGTFLGFFDPIGDLDVYLNKGAYPQINKCPLDPSGECSHRQSYEVYADAVNSADDFVAYQCDNYELFLNGSCSSNPTTLLAESVDRTAEGIFYVASN